MICINSILVDCEWGAWVEGDCSTTCGTGEQTNTRTKLVKEAHGGKCTGGFTDVTSCLVAECPGMYLSGTFNKKNSAYLRHMYIAFIFVLYQSFCFYKRLQLH